MYENIDNMNTVIIPEKVTLYEDFLKNTAQDAIQRLTPETKGLWGKMKVQDMVEHLEVNVIASTILELPPAEIPSERQKQARGLIYTDVPMARNLYNPTLQYGLPPLKYSSLDIAIEKLLTKITVFFKSFEKKPSGHSLNMFLGDLNYAENVAFHYKHFKHHLTQFGMIKDENEEEI